MTLAQGGEKERTTLPQLANGSEANQASLITITKVMTQKFRLYRRGNGRFYIEDNTTGKQESLGTSDKAEALRLLMAKNEAEQQPAFNAQIAKTYLAAGDPALPKRTWKEVMEAFVAARAERRESTRGRETAGAPGRHGLPCVLRCERQAMEHATACSAFSSAGRPADQARNDPPYIGADPELHRLPERVTPALALSPHPSPCTTGPASAGGARVNADRTRGNVRAKRLHAPAARRCASL